MNYARAVSGVLAPVMVVSLGLAGTGGAQAQGATISVPEDTVVRLRLTDRLSSQEARVGDRFASALAPDDHSGFPVGTRFEGNVTEVERRSADRPGLMNVEVRRAYLPDGQKVDVDGRLAGLANEDVRRTEDGRLESRRAGGASGKKPDWKWAGIGAAGGALLSGIIGGSVLRGILLGGVGGAAYGYLNRKGGDRSYHEVDLPRDTEFGMRLDNRVLFTDESSYRYTTRVAANVGDRRDDDRPAVDPRRDDDRRLDDRRDDDRIGDRRPADPGRDDRDSDNRERDDRDRNDRDVRDREDQDRDDRTPEDRRVDRDDADRTYRDDRSPVVRNDVRYDSAAVYVNGRSVRFVEDRPHNLNGQLYVPLAPIADAAGWRFDHRAGESVFTLVSRSGPIDGHTGDTRVLTGDGRTVDLRDAPISLDGEIFVPQEYLSRVAGFRTRWDRAGLRLDLDTDRPAAR